MVIILYLIVIFILPPAVSSENKTSNTVANETSNISNITSITYKSLVDQDYGFYRVIDIITHKPAPYENNTLTINIGDIVIWENDAAPDEPLTIISKQGLWGNRSAYLRWNYQKFNYTFNQSGAYSVYIKEYPREQHQIIIVKDIPGTVKIISTPTMTTTILPASTIVDGDNIDITEISEIDKTVALENPKRGYVLYYIIAGFIIIMGIIMLINRINKEKKQ